MAHESVAKLISAAVGWTINASSDLHPQESEAVSVVVDAYLQPQETQTHSPPKAGGDHIGLQPVGMRS